MSGRRAEDAWELSVDEGDGIEDVGTWREIKLGPTSERFSKPVTLRPNRVSVVLGHLLSLIQWWAQFTR